LAFWYWQQRWRKWRKDWSWKNLKISSTSNCYWWSWPPGVCIEIRTKPTRLKVTELSKMRINSVPVYAMERVLLYNFIYNGRFIRCVCFSGRELLKLTDKYNVYRLTTLTET
jgi:hypothetical protein